MTQDPTNPGLFRKKPVVIEAMHLSEDDMPLERARAIAGWCGGTVVTSDPPGRSDASYGVEIKTLEGTMLASPGDYVIRGVQGEFYPCKSDIFEQTYEPAIVNELVDVFEATIDELRHAELQEIIDAHRAGNIIVVLDPEETIGAALARVVESNKSTS